MAVSGVGFRKNATHLVVGCAKPGCLNRDHYRLGYGGQWTLETCVPCSCPPGPGVPTAVFGSTAIPTPALIEFILPLVTADSAVKSSVLKAALSSVMLRTPNASLIQRIRSGAVRKVVGDPLDAIQRLPAYCAALTKLGHRAHLHLLNKQEMIERLIEIKYLVQ